MTQASSARRRTPRRISFQGYSGFRRLRRSTRASRRTRRRTSAPPRSRFRSSGRSSGQRLGVRSDGVESARATAAPRVDRRSRVPRRGAARHRRHGRLTTDKPLAVLEQRDGEPEAHADLPEPGGGRAGSRVPRSSCLPRRTARHACEACLLTPDRSAAEDGGRSAHRASRLSAVARSPSASASRAASAMPNMAGRTSPSAMNSSNALPPSTSASSRRPSARASADSASARVPAIRGVLVSSLTFVEQPAKLRGLRRGRHARRAARSTSRSGS